MDFIHYSDLELKIFERAKSYFEKLPPTASDDYKNGFYDLVAQYSGDGYEYELMGSMNKDLIESTVSDEYNKLSKPKKKELQELYEENFLERYYDTFEEGYLYTEGDLVSEICERFKSWIDENFNLDELLENKGSNEKNED
jgi:hypothetical protein